jgi:hypothetical protein
MAKIISKLSALAVASANTPGLHGDGGGHNKVEAAYQRGDLLDKRRELMAEWGEYCANPASTAGSVVSLKA